MASKFSSDSLKSLCKCPVCFEAYKDPRLLKCGHQFCEKCLKDIVDRHPQHHAKCPVCRDVTNLKYGDVTSLPRATLLTHMQEIVFGEPTEETLGQACTKCQVNKPTRHCHDCAPDLAYLCEECYVIHQQVKRFARHETVKFDPRLICADHKHKMVENFCHTCTKVTCVECLFDGHRNHRIEPLDEVAAKKRQTIEKYVANHKDKTIDINSLSQVSDMSQKLDQCQKEWLDTLGRIQASKSMLDKKISMLDERIKSTVADEKKKLSGFENDVRKTQSPREKRMKLCESLLSADVSDPQVILGSMDLPEGDADGTELTISVNVPVLGDEFEEIAKGLDELCSRLKFVCTQESLPIIEQIPNDTFEKKKRKNRKTREREREEARLRAPSWKFDYIYK